MKTVQKSDNFATKLQIAQVAMEKAETKISDLCKELGITCQNL